MDTSPTVAAAVPAIRINHTQSSGLGESDQAAPTTMQHGGAPGLPSVPVQPVLETTLLKYFVETWFFECKTGWRQRYQESVRNTLDVHLISTFAKKRMHEIHRADVLAFRAELAEKPGRQSDTLSNSRVNTVMTSLHQVLTEAPLRYTDPIRTILLLGFWDEQSFTATGWGVCLAFLARGTSGTCRAARCYGSVNCRERACA